MNQLAFGQDLLQDGINSREALIAIHGSEEVRARG
jgi:hypothetical protein